ncbi:MAG: signal peptidase I [Lactobacillales bacterium]|jgi:signal peptidase I|nr:signal peptidase I [Lactobacillales bacterium]
MANGKKKGGFFSNLIGILLAVLAALLLRSVLIEPYNIPSSSMVPTLLIGDYLFISKYPYGYSKHSFPFSIPIIPNGRIFEGRPESGDVVIFKVPTDNKTDYIKRVIGLPGDTIQMKAGRLYINNIIVEREELSKEEFVTESGLNRYTKYMETLPGGKKHLIYEISDTKQTDDTLPVLVPAGHYFMMGDNRDNSMDSRFFGTVPAENLEGRGEIIFYSNNGKGAFWEIWKWPESLRLERFFTRIK